MYSDDIKMVLKNYSYQCENPWINTDLLNTYKTTFADEEYYNFITKNYNGGFFWGLSLHFYAFSALSDYGNIETVNGSFLAEYGAHASGLITIGQDIFANQFVCEVKTGKFFLFNCETAETELLGNSFSSFIEHIVADIEFYTGKKLLDQFEKGIKLNQRLCPKIPFVIGGEYVQENFYACNFPQYFEFYADLAKQVHELPDGTPIKLKVLKGID